MNWEVILWTCITISVLLLICGIVIIIFSTVNMKKRREIVSEVHTTLKVCWWSLWSRCKNIKR